MDIEKNENIMTEEVVETAEQVAETVETTTEKTPRTYTEEEFEAELNARVNQKLDEVLPGKIARRENRIRKEYEQKYGEFESTIRTGTGKQNESIEEITKGLRQFYGSKGVKFPEQPQYSDHDIAVLANAEAQDIIRSGFDEVIEETDRLAAIGFDNMSKKEKAIFKTLAEHRHATERENALAGIGVPKDVYNSKEFQKFAGMFRSDVPITDVYKQYAKTIKPQVEPIGSMKNGSHDDGKTFYTPEEVDKLTPKDYDNPVIFQRVRDSMKLWK